jgi:hypothetical protein
MKRLILFLAIFGVLLANAQEMDTTFVVNGQGQTIGVIHEKGTVPVIPQQQPMPQQQQYPVQQMQPQMQYQANPAFDVDSTAYYQSQVERFTQTGNKLNRAGIGLMIGGGIGTAIGLAMFISGVNEDNCEETYANNYECEGNALDVGGALILSAGTAIFTTGLVLKLVGGSKIRRANRYQESLTNYQMRRQYSLKMRLDPTINIAKNNVGARLALEF